jgi:hypothetical protein
VPRSSEPVDLRAKHARRVVELRDAVPAVRVDVPAPSAPLPGARRQARERGTDLAVVPAEDARLAAQRGESGGLEQRRLAMTAQFEQARREQHAELTRLTAAVAAARQDLAAVRREVVQTRETVLLQEAGVYEYQHPLQDSVAYKTELSRLRDRIRMMTLKDGGAVEGSSNWTVNGSLAQGRTMVTETSKLMLRAYNAEADSLVRGLKPYKLASSKERLTKVVTTIERLGRTMAVRISPDYHHLRLLELDLTADYVDKLAAEKEHEREERTRLREERKAQEEIERERARLLKEQSHYQNALAQLRSQGDVQGVARMQAQLAEIGAAIQSVDHRAANIRAGYVYVISNLGAFGPDMVKIGMTRRLEPMDRVRELGDASVPFRFDVHALFFSADAVGIEAKLHAHFADRRVNQINQRREFFYATPAQVRDQLLRLTGELLTFEESPEALEFRQSGNGSA